MNTKQHLGEPEAYWNRAGELSYAQAMYSSADVERHVRLRLWNVAIDIAAEIAIPNSGRVLDFGCGDGAFANETLASRYSAIDGYDLAPAAIERANAAAPGPHLKFFSADLLALDYSALPRYDGAFLIGILHHVKAATPDVLRSLAQVTDKIVVLEPNGNNIVRKLLELAPSYRSAGEDSFRTHEMIDIFSDTGWRTVVKKRLNLFPNFTPSLVYRLLAPLEPYIERSSLLNALCTVNMFGAVRQ
jgi:SAM-dependent methyltransferase